MLSLSCAKEGVKQERIPIHLKIRTSVKDEVILEYIT